MEQAEREHRAILIVEDDAALRSLAAALFEDEQVNTIECESAEAALAIMLIGGRDIAMISPTSGFPVPWTASIWHGR
jgi:CheY-like chemotaxis protein